jgi:ribonuclease E
MSREMLVNVAEREECRVAVIDNGSLEELYIERSSIVSHVGNIYKGKIVNIEPGIQAAFIDFGISKNGFLHISDLHPKYFSSKSVKEHIGRRKALKDRPPIQKCLKKGQEVVVQVTKEGINTKGPTLSTYISLPGKYVVMMPWMNRLGISQKIEDEAERDRLKKIVEESKSPKDVGFIIRTAAASATKRDVQNDISYLNRLWTAIRKRIDKANVPSELYQESDLVIRTIRDIFDSKIRKIICDNEGVTKKIRDFLGIVQPRLKNRASNYGGKVPLFHKYGIEDEISKIHSSRVELKSGGSIVIEQTEALVAIDVNSGKYRKHENAEKTALKINSEAAVEIVRQLKLRDMGGLIICDFIDMRDSKNRRKVEKIFRDGLKKDRARSRVLRMSAFGLIELTRQRIRPSLQSSTYLTCPYCKGAGAVKSYESQSIELMRKLVLASGKNNIKMIELAVAPPVADFLQNQKRRAIASLEGDSEKVIKISADQNCPGSEYELKCFDERGSVVKTEV